METSKKYPDQCSLCDRECLEKNSALVIEGQNIKTFWVHSNKDPFENAGMFGPMNGKISIIICVDCLKTSLSMDYL